MATIPRWVPPIASADKLQDRRTTQTIAADSTPIPVAYGEVQAPGRVFAVDYDDGTWTIGALFCIGECESLSVLLNGSAPPSGVDVNTYLGTTSQTPDPMLSAAISGYDDDLVIEHPAGDIGVCYAVIQYTDDDFSSFPQILGEIEGRRVYDPDADSTGYSQNPSLALRDLITSPHFGLGEPVIEASAIAAAATNDADVDGEPRRTINLLLEQSRPTPEWIEILATYAGCWAHKRGDAWVLTPDRPASATTLGREDVRMAPPAFADPAQAPTVVEVQYTDKSETPWRERSAFAMLDGVSTGTVPRRESLVRLPGVDRFSQATREAHERLNKLNRSLLTASGTVFDDLIGLELGDVIEIDDHPLYPTHTLFRIAEPPMITGPGRLEFRAAAYSADDYNDSKPSFSWPAAPGINGDPQRQPKPGADQTARHADDINFRQDTAPANPQRGWQWIDTSTSPQTIRRWSGTEWEVVGQSIAGQNLLGSDAGPTHSLTGNQRHNYAGFAENNGASPADVGLAVGDVISFSGEMRVTSGSDINAFFMLRFRESAGGATISTHQTPAITSVTGWQRYRMEGIEIPEGTGAIEIRATTPSAASSSREARRAMLNLGPVALPFEEPPARIGRGEVEEGADVTADHADDITHRGATAPADPKAGWVWADTSTTPATVKRWSGSAWETIGTLNVGALADLDAVDTDKIEPNAVSDDVSAFTAGATGVPNGTFSQVQTATIFVPTGFDVRVRFSLRIGDTAAGANTDFRVFLRSDSGEAIPPIIYDASGLDQSNLGWVSGGRTDTPTNDGQDVTYRLTVQNDNTAGNLDVQAREIDLVILKR